MPALVGVGLAPLRRLGRSSLNGMARLSNKGLMHRVFILSPAKTTGKRAQMLLSERATFDLAQRLRGPSGVTLGEVFSFMSGLYFRGKLTYANRFASPAPGLRGCYVITSDAGLVPCDTLVTRERLERFGATPIDPSEERYREPLRFSACELRSKLPRRAEIVLLGSIATGKYVDVLHDCLGEQLLFPREFIGRGDMSRGGLLLRCAEAGTELDYITIGAAESRTGKRPPKLTPVPRKPADPRSADRTR
jgi:hypothetical protein